LQFHKTPDRAVAFCSAPRVGSKKATAPHQSFLGHSAAVTAIAHSGNTIVTADSGECILFWRCAPALRSALPARATNDVQDVANAALNTSAGQAEAPLPEAESSADSPQEPRSTRVVPQPATRSAQAAIGDPVPPVYGSLPGVPHSELPGVPQAMPAGRQSDSRAPRVTCDCVVGLCASEQSNMLWLPPQGLLAYAVDNTVVIEDLQGRRQRYLVMNQQRITSLAAVGPKSPVIGTAAECVPPCASVLQ
jgi:hypothetical protein